MNRRILIAFIFFNAIGNSFAQNTKELEIEKIKLAKEIISEVNSDNIENIQNIALKVFKDKKFNQDKELIDFLFNQTNEKLTIKSNCDEKIKFAEFILDYHPNEPKIITDKKSLFIISMIENKIKKSKIIDWKCNSKIFEIYLNNQYINLENNKNYKLTRAATITKILYEDQGNKLDNVEEETQNSVNIYIFINKALTSKKKNSQNEGEYYFDKTEGYLSPFWTESIIVDNEFYFFDVQNKSDYEVIKKISRLGGYYAGNVWPFKSSYKEKLLELVNYKFKDVQTRDMILVFTSSPLIKLMQELDTTTANNLYKKIINIDSIKVTQRMAEKYKEENEKRIIYVMHVLVEGFKLNAAIGMGDLNTATKIYEKNIGKLNIVFKELKVENNIFKQELNILLNPYYYYNSTLGRKEEAYKIIKLGLDKSEVDFDKLNDYETGSIYIKENKEKFNGKINSLLWLLQDYNKLIKKENDIIDLAISSFNSESFKNPSIYFREIGVGIKEFDEEHSRLFLNIFKTELQNLRHSKSYYLFLSLYDMFDSKINELKIIKELNNKEKIKWIENYLIEFNDIYGLIYLNEKASAEYTDKLYTTFLLFDLNKNVERTEEAYFYAGEFLKVIMDGVKSANKNIAVENQFKTHNSKKLDEIIEFYLNIDRLEEAKETITIFKEQRFLELINRGPEYSRARIKFNDESVSEDIKNKFAEIDLIDRKANSTLSAETKKLLENMRLQVSKEIKELYAKKKVQSEVDPFNVIRKTSNIGNHAANVDYYIKSNSLYIIYSSSKDTIKIKNELPNEFSNKISELYSLYTSPKSSIEEISKINKYFYEMLVAPIEGQISSEGIEKIYIRSNTFMSSVPFFNIIDTAQRKTSINVIFQGVANLNTDNFSINEKASLFGTDKKHGDLLALTFASQELKFISESYKNKFLNDHKSKIYLNEKYDLNTLSREFNSNSNVIHLATHFSRNNNGMFLLGTGENITTRRLWGQLTEVHQPRLVTISACESGLLSYDSPSSENLPNVFISKGAQFVLASTWKISDEATATFMNLYYEILLNIENPIESLRITQRTFKDGNFYFLNTSNQNLFKLLINKKFKFENYKHPFYWAGFQIITAQK